MTDWARDLIDIITQGYGCGVYAHNFLTGQQLDAIQEFLWGSQEGWSYLIKLVLFWGNNISELQTLQQKSQSQVISKTLTQFRVSEKLISFIRANRLFQLAAAA